MNIYLVPSIQRTIGTRD